MIAYDVPVEDDRFGKTADCPANCEAGQARRLRRVRRAYKWAGVGERYRHFTLADFGHHQDAVDAIVELWDEGTIRASDGWPFFGVYLHGPTGTGKTALVSAVANELTLDGVDVIICRVAQMLDQFRASFDPRSEVKSSDLFDAATRATVLILDDLGAHTTTPWAVEKVIELVNARDSNASVTLVTSNLNPAELETAFGDDWQARRLASRIIGLCYPVEMTGGDIRKGEAA